MFGLSLPEAKLPSGSGLEWCGMVLVWFGLVSTGRKRVWRMMVAVVMVMMMVMAVMVVIL